MRQTRARRPAKASDSGSPSFITTARGRRTRTRSVGVSTTGWSLVGTHDLIELCRVVHRTISRQMDATIFFLGLYDVGSQTIEVVWQVENGKELSGGSFPLGNGVTSQVILMGRPYLIRNWSVEGPRVQVEYSTETPGLPESAIAVPLKYGEHVIGLMCIQSYAHNAYDTSDLELMEDLAREAQTVIAGLHFSERMAAQARRRASELEAILANMADALLSVDSDGRIVRLNRAARELLSLHEASIVYGRPLRGQWDGWPVGGRAVAEALQSIIEGLQTTHAPREVEVEVTGVVRRTLNFRATPIQENGTFSGGVIIFTDVTGRREVERFKDDMFSIASHDLKTPVTVIKTEAQYLQRRIKKGEYGNAQESLRVISDQSDRLSNLIDLLQDLSRIESGRLVLDPQPTDLRAILLDMSRALQGTSEIHDIEVIAPDAVVGMWDLHRLEEVVQNLLSNAVKYSPNGGCIQVSLTADDDSASVVVLDTGIGLAPEEVPHVFERFFRGQGSGRLEGTGLGLYICHAIVSAHGGRIWAQSDGPHQGSQFGFTLPLGRSGGEA